MKVLGIIFLVCGAIAVAAMIISAFVVNEAGFQPTGFNTAQPIVAISCLGAGLTLLVAAGKKKAHHEHSR